MKKFNSKKDFEKLVEDQPIFGSEYVEDYIEIVAENLIILCLERGFFWGDEMPEITEKEFWSCFLSAEKN
jgi:hypothetical protein